MGAAKRTIGVVGGLCVCASFAVGEERPQALIEVVEVVAPLDLGTVDAHRDTLAATAEDIAAERAPSLADFLARNAASVFVNEAQGNPLQPDVRYRGFVGSPLLGLPQGLAVYLDGVRANEPFGDTVSWALIPQSAVDAVALLPGSNPLFGLNALGGALSVYTKDGFSHAGTRLEASVGSFGRRTASAETGGTGDARFGYFGTLSTLREDGWRDYSPTAATQGFAKLSWLNGDARVDASVVAADTDLIGNGAAPEELLAMAPKAVFTRPDRTRNALFGVNLVGDYSFSERLAVRGNVYWRRSDIDTYNGDDSDYEACAFAPAFLCAGDDDSDDGEESDLDQEALEDERGNPIAASDALEGATINRTRTAQRGRGFGLHAEHARDTSAWPNRLVLGLAYDAADVDFDSSTELGALDQTRLAVPGGVFVGDAFTEVAVATSNASLYVAESFAPSPRLRVDLAARYNAVRVELRDQRGTALNGKHRFARLNPSLGVVFAATPTLAFHASYGESSRAPSPVELTCADEDDPCRLPNAFLADPPLAQVVARTWEAALNGHRNGWAWRGGWFRTRNQDDILFVSAGSLASEGYFDNVGATLRRGFEASVSREGARLRWFVHYTQMRATFESAFSVPSVNHPLAEDGAIAVRPGDRLPLVPERLLKAGLTVAATPRLDFSATVLYASGIRFRGDEGNLAPGIDGHAVANLRFDYRLGDRLTLFANVDNAFDEDYATFGVFGEADEVLGEAFESSRFVTPAAPRAGWVGVEWRR